MHGAWGQDVKIGKGPGGRCRYLKEFCTPMQLKEVSSDDRGKSHKM